MNYILLVLMLLVSFSKSSMAIDYVSIGKKHAENMIRIMSSKPEASFLGEGLDKTLFDDGGTGTAFLSMLLGNLCSPKLGSESLKRLDGFIDVEMVLEFFQTGTLVDNIGYSKFLRNINFSDEDQQRFKEYLSHFRELLKGEEVLIGTDFETVANEMDSCIGIKEYKSRKRELIRYMSEDEEYQQETLAARDDYYNSDLGSRIELSQEITVKKGHLNTSNLSLIFEGIEIATVNCDKNNQEGISALIINGMENAFMKGYRELQNSRFCSNLVNNKIVELSDSKEVIKPDSFLAQSDICLDQSSSKQDLQMVKTVTVGDEDNSCTVTPVNDYSGSDYSGKDFSVNLLKLVTLVKINQIYKDVYKLEQKMDDSRKARLLKAVAIQIYSHNRLISSQEIIDSAEKCFAKSAKQRIGNKIVTLMRDEIQLNRCTKNSISTPANFKMVENSGNLTINFGKEKGITLKSGVEGELSGKRVRGE